MLELLRAETQPLHKEAEKHNLAKYIVDHSINLSQYKRLMRNYYKIYGGVYEYLSKHASSLSDEVNALVDFQKITLLAQDLQALDIQKPALVVPESFKILTCNNALALGILYTVEGSMLGRKMIAKHISECEELKQVPAFYFFDTAAMKTSKTWPTIVGLIKNNLFDEQAQKSVLLGARSTFQLFIE